MSIETTKPVSESLNELIQKANSTFEQGKHYVVLAYEQALKEGFTPQEAKKLLFEKITAFSDRTIYRYLPDEAKDQNAVELANSSKRNLPSLTVGNDSLESKQLEEKKVKTRDIKTSDEYEKLVSLPYTDKKTYEGIKQSIKEYGQFYPISLNSENVILDGYLRYRACKELGIEYMEVKYRDFPTKLHEKEFIIDINTKRAHLNEFCRIEQALKLERYDIELEHKEMNEMASKAKTYEDHKQVAIKSWNLMKRYEAMGG